MKAQFCNGEMVKFICIDCDLPIHDLDFVAQLASEICKKIGMTPLAGPFSAIAENDENEKNNGVSVVLLIYESHIAIHTWPYYKAIRVIVDSCLPFSIKKISDFFEYDLNIKNIYIYKEHLTPKSAAFLNNF